MTSSTLDLDALRVKYSSMDESELLAIVSLDANKYEDGAILTAREELRRRGIDGARLDQRALELKAERYDELTSDNIAGDAELPRWMFWVCLIESGIGGVSVWILLFLLWKDRKSAAKTAVIAMAIGLAIKALFFVVLDA